jgi:hypothetical protein
MLMDVYHPDFRESIAIDLRILSISEKLRLSLKNYLEHQQCYLNVAHNAALEGWELDRLMYWFKKEFLDGLGSLPSTAQADLPHRRKRRRLVALKEPPR